MPTGENLVGFFLFGELRGKARKGAEGRANRPREGVARCGRRRVAALIPFCAGLVCLADLALLILIDPKLTLTDSN